MKETVESLCRRYTGLNREEIAYIQAVSEELQHWADAENMDVFINCACPNGDSVVVAQASPAGAASAYRHSVVGMLSKPVNEPAVARTFQLGCTTRRMRAINQERVPVIQVATPIRRNERVIGVLTYERQVGQCDTPDPLAENFQDVCQQADYKSTDTGVDSNWFWLAEYIDEALLVVDKQGYVSYRNTFARRLYAKLGYVEDILGQQYKNVSLADFPVNVAAPPVEAEVGKFVLSVRQVRIQEPEVDFVVVIKDITNQKATERELILKSVVVQEMHHRVKNNLQMVASLLRLQMGRTENEETKRVVTETSNRILAIASTHQLLAQNGVDKVKLKEVIENIKANALRSCTPSHMDIRIEILGDDFNVDSDVATTVGLVVNELFQNSLQHAFVGRDHGRIELTIREEKLYATITIVDDGVGFRKQGENLGLTIVKVMVGEKLKGSFRITSSPSGTKVMFDFLI